MRIHLQKPNAEKTAANPPPPAMPATRRSFLKTASAGALGLSLPRLLRAAAPTDRPNILWITFEDTSAAFLGCYGCKSVRTPNLDRHAAALAPLGQAD